MYMNTKSMRAVHDNGATIKRICYNTNGSGRDLDEDGA